jgi:hypothetical protein
MLVTQIVSCGSHGTGVGGAAPADHVMRVTCCSSQEIEGGSVCSWAMVDGVCPHLLPALPSDQIFARERVQPVIGRVC